MGLFENDLINQYHNRYLLALLHIINQLKPEESITSSQLKQQLRRFTNEGCVNSDDLLIDGMIDAAINGGLIKNMQQKIHKTCNAPIIPPAALTERIYLKNILQSSYAPLFLEADTIQTLLEQLTDAPDMKFSEIVRFCGTASEPEFSDTYINNFHKLVEAIQKKRMIRFVNHAHNGNIYQNYAFPVKIEFSVIHRKFWLSLWHINEKRPFKADIERICDIELLEEVSENEYRKTLEMMEKRKEPLPIVMKINNYNNAIERANLQFSMYQREIEVIDEDTIQMSLHYYSFDRDELLNTIMTFGPAIRVTGPPCIIEEIKNRLYLSMNR